MSVKQHDIYAIPGWGFSSASLSVLNCECIKIIGLNYIGLKNPSLDSIAKDFAMKIPNKSTVLGWSLGGLVALKLSFLFPEKVDKLILISTSPRFLADANWQGVNKKQSIQFVEKFEHNFKKQLLHFFNLTFFPKMPNLAFRKHLVFDEKKLLTLLRILFGSDLRAEYQKITSRTLHLISQDDAILNQPKAQFVNINSSVQVVGLDKLSHAGFLENNKVYKSTIKEFLHAD